MALWPGDILTLAHALRTDAGLDVFRRVGDLRLYEENEELELSTADAGRWLAETNRLSQILNDPRRTAGERLHRFLEGAVRPADLIRLGWAVPPHSIAACQSVDGAATITRQTVFVSRVEGVLADVISLCVSQVP